MYLFLVKCNPWMMQVMHPLTQDMCTKYHGPRMYGACIGTVDGVLNRIIE